MNGLRIEWIQASFFYRDVGDNVDSYDSDEKERAFLAAGSPACACRKCDRCNGHKFEYQIYSGNSDDRIYCLPCVCDLMEKGTYTAVCAYAVQHLAYTVGMIEKCIRGILFHVPHAPTDSEPDINLKMFLTVALVYGTCYLFFVRKKEEKESLTSVSDRLLDFQ